MTTEHTQESASEADLSPVKVTLKRGMKGEYGYEAYVRANTVDEATRQLDDVDRWFRGAYGTANYRG